jgi:NTP pyrophosphatase (non-canonical NTP hydrolase)
MLPLKIEERKAILQKALNTWGEVAQLDMVIEEASELIQAIQKYKRKPTEENSQHILEEMADVYIMLGQLEVLLDSYPAEGRPDLTEWVKRKLNRLQNRLES